MLRQQNDATAERLVEEGQAAHQPLAVPTQYAASFWCGCGGRVQRRGGREGFWSVQRLALTWQPQQMQRALQR